MHVKTSEEWRWLKRLEHRRVSRLRLIEPRLGGSELWNHLQGSSKGRIVKQKDVRNTAAPLRRVFTPGL